MEQGCYTLIGRSPNDKSYAESQMKADLENNSIPIKTAALKELIKMYANGEKMNNILMTVIRFVMPCQDHLIKKLLFVFWEIFPRYDADGKLLQEMILVCDNYRKDLQHPNEYIRGCTLRFLCKIKEAELLEPLMPTIQACLDHRHPYVRRNAVLAIYTIYKNFDFLIPDAPEKMLNYLQQEQDASCKRNAFIMLTHVSQPLAFEYLIKCIDEVPHFDDILQLVVVELIYKFCHKNPNEKTRFIRCVYGLLQSNSPSVRYEAAGTLVTLSNAPSAVKAVANCYINLIVKENDNNVKLIVMDRLMSLRIFNERIIQDMVMEIVAILNSSDLELREKTLEFIADLCTNRTVRELSEILIKQLSKSCIEAGAMSNTTETNKNDSESKFRYCLVRTIFEISNKFPEIISIVIPSMCQTLTYSEVANSEAAYEICRFLRHSAQKYPETRSIMIQRLISYLPQIAGNRTLKFALWLMGEFCKSLEEIENFMSLIPQVLGDVPLVENELKRINGNEDFTDDILLSNEPTLKTVTKLTADGTYATETALASKNISKKLNRPNLQALLFEGDFLPGITLAVSLVKLFLKQSKNFEESREKDAAEKRKNSMAAECMLIISSMIRLGSNKYNFLQNNVNPDLLDRLWMCFRLLNDSNRMVLSEFYETSIIRLDEMLDSQESERRAAANLRKANNGSSLSQKKQNQENKNKLDGPIEFSLLNNGQGNWLEGDDRFERTLMQALGSENEKNLEMYNSSNLDKVTQLTGSSDPVYAEAYVNINQFDIILDILLVNMTTDTLQNLTIELSTLGDLKLVERPQPITLAAEDFTNIKASIKVSSTENGVIFGNIVYDLRGSSGESTCIIMNNINIDILEYIIPSTCTPAEYRDMWSEFEWENKVTVNTQITNLQAYLAHIVKSTNFNCLTSPEAMSGECDYLCVTLYAKSIFGENVLANLCLEKSSPNSPVSGHIRIRAKTQGMAVNIGDKISQGQKQPISPELIKELKAHGISMDNQSKTDELDGSDILTDIIDNNNFVDCVA